MKKYKWERPMNSRSKLFNAARKAFTKVSYVHSKKMVPLI